MNRLKPDVDVTKDVLKAVLAAQPGSSFIQSLLQQYEERGGLSKKQLQGLYDKASKIETSPRKQARNTGSGDIKKAYEIQVSTPAFRTPL